MLWPELENGHGFHDNDLGPELNLIVHVVKITNQMLEIFMEAVIRW